MEDLKSHFERLQSRLNRLTDELLKYDVRIIFIALMEQLEEIKNLKDNFRTLENCLDKNFPCKDPRVAGDDFVTEHKYRTLH